MSTRLPAPEDNAIDYARFSNDLWTGLDGKYSFYVDRWRRTLEFLRDQHWNTLKGYSREVLPEWRRFPLQNYTLAFYNDYLTDYLKSEVRYSALPASPDPSDIDAAELADQLMKFLWEKLDMDRLRIDLGAWIMSCGTGCVRIYWNTNTGNQIPLGIPQEDGSIMAIDPETMQPMPPGSEPVMVDAGDIGFEVVSPQFVRWAENPAHGVMLGLLVTYEDAQTFYGTEVADRLSYSSTHAGISADLNQIEQPGMTPSVDQRALVIEHYLPKSAQNPNGLWWTSAQGGSLLVHPPWPLPAGVIPIVSFRWIPIPGEEHIGMSPLYGITFGNKIYEEITAKILEWYAKAKPKRLLKAGGGITHGDITDEPYQELVVNAGGEPEMLDVDDAPRGLFQMLGQIQNDMQFVSGRPFEEQDQLPEGLAKGSFRSTEVKASRAVTIGHLASRAAWKKVGEILMYYVGNFYNENRFVGIQGPDRGYLWRQFAGKDLLREGGLAATLRVDEIPLVPHNRQNLRDTTIALLQSQAGQIMFAGADGQLDMDRVKGALQATGLDVNLDVVDPDYLEARNEEMTFQFLKPGEEPPKLEMWQNHNSHWDTHVKIPKSLAFKAWSQENQQAFLAHLQETGEKLNEAAEQEAQSMVDQEQKLRAVREQESLKADVMKEWAKSLIELVAETTGLEVEHVLKLAQKTELKQAD